VKRRGHAAVQSHQLAAERFACLDDHLSHLHIWLVTRCDVAVWHEEAQLIVLQVALSQQSLEHGQHMSDDAAFALTQYDYAIDLIHTAPSRQPRQRQRARRIFGTAPGSCDGTPGRQLRVVLDPPLLFQGLPRRRCLVLAR